MSPDSTELVIFDCDGVLINTEDISIDIDVQVLEALGWPLDRDTVIERFLGRSHADFVRDIEQELGRPLADGWEAAYQHLYEEAFAAELVAIDGVAELLEQLHLPFCVASSSRHEHLRRRLGQVGLYEHFEGRVFSAEDVARGKPFPDVFLHAASCMDIDPAKCLVIEDSPAGIQAATAAGMRVLVAGSTIVPRERFAPELEWLHHMSELPAMLGAPSR